MKLILASGSPRRKELLALLRIPFEVLVSDVEEEMIETDPVLLTEELSRQKAGAVSELWKEKKALEDFCVIGADTVVFMEDEEANRKILGKPVDREDAHRMLRSLQGHMHMVCTGVTVFWKQGEESHRLTFSENTKVFVAAMSEVEMETYLDTEEPYDKAGAYGIQGSFSRFVEKIDGDYFNVVGLPVHRLYQVLRDEVSGLAADLGAG